MKHLRFVLFILSLSVITAPAGENTKSLAQKISSIGLRSHAILDFPEGDAHKKLQEITSSTKALQLTQPAPAMANLSELVGEMVCLRLVGGSWLAFSQTTCLVIQRTPEKCLVITCAHLIPAVIDIHGCLIGVANSKGEIGLSLKCLTLDRKADLAIFEVVPIFSHAAELARKQALVGSPLVTIGVHPDIGLIQLRGHTINQANNGFVFSDIRAVSGMSGSPCFTDDGRAIGLIREIVPSLRPARENGSDLFSEATYTKIRLFNLSSEDTAEE